MWTPDNQVNIGEAMWFAVGINQGKTGIEVDLKAHPKIENFFKQLSGGNTKPIEAQPGKSWTDPKGVGLHVYNLTNSSPDTEGISFLYPGYGFSLADEVGGPYSQEGSNISCLRIVGISNSDGIRLGVKGIMSLSAQRNLAKQLTHNVRKFVRGYINTARVEYKLTGREVGLSYTKEW